MGILGVSEGKKNDPTSMLATDPIIGMNLSSSQMEPVQPWGLGHSSLLVPHINRT
jgi:hypothetical protein